MKNFNKKMISLFLYSLIMKTYNNEKKYKLL